MNTKEMILSQITSGRWLLTVASAVALLALVRADLIAVSLGKPLPISTEAIFSIITMVFVSYFNRPTEKTNGNGNGEVKPEVKPEAKPEVTSEILKIPVK